jgi:transcriptional regulator with XRE-family HTH domain
MKNTAKDPQFLSDPDNVEFNEFILRLSNLGVTQQEIADILGVSADQVSRVKKGERRASIKHLRKLRTHVRKLTNEQNSEPQILAPKSIAASVFGINHAVLSRLSAGSAVEAFRDLVWARAMKLGISTTRVSISADVYSADGGVDASILEGDGIQIDDDDLLTAGTRFQIKTGDFAAWQKSQVEKELFGKKAQTFENLGSEIQETLRAEKRFVLVSFGTDPIDRDIRKARKNFKEAFERCGYPDAKVEVWGQTQLLGLFQSYPSLCLRLRGHDHQGFRSHFSWSLDDDMQPREHYSPEQQRLIEDLRDDLRSGRFPHVRLIGEPGVGKTRLALELTKTEDIAPITLYVKDGRSLLQSSFINELVQIDDTRFVLFVIDECSPKELADIWNILKPRSNRLRAITIDHGPDNTVDDKTRVVVVEPTGTEQIVSILMDHKVGRNDAQRWAEYCEGCPRVAHVIGTNLIANPSDLLASPTTAEVWRRFIDGRDAADSEEVQLRRIVLRYIALFERFGFETPVQEEANFIQRLAERCDHRITRPRFREIVSELRSRRIIQGTTTLYLTPRLLHVHLYREFWRLYGSGFDIAVTLGEMPQTLWHWFIQMLRYAHGCSAAEKAIAGLLGYDGLFPNGHFPDTQHAGRLISALAETCPQQTLRCLRRTIGKMDVESLRNITVARQWLVWTLEKLAVWEDCFVNAAELLLGLAEAENATISNNATGTFIELFSLIPSWGPTQANPNVRLRVLVSALDSDSTERRRLGLKACASALFTGWASRTVGPEHQGLRATIQFWMPKTYGELWDAYRAVWQLLLDRLITWRGDDRKTLISTIIEASWSTLHIEPLTALVVETLDTIAFDDDTDIKELIQLIRRQLSHKESQLPSDIKGRLKSIYERLDGHDFVSKLRRFVKHITWEDYHDDELNDTDLVDRKLDELAAEARENEGLLIPELPWLICEESSPAYYFAFRISKLDTQRSMLSMILEQYETHRKTASTSFLGGYLAAIFDRDVEEWESVMLELARHPSIADRFSDFVITSGMSDRMAMQVMDQCRSGLQSKERLERWWFAGQLQKLSEDVVKELIDFQLEDALGSLWKNAVQMCHAFYVEKGSEKRLPEKLTFRLLTSEAMAAGRATRHSAGYRWSQLAKAFMDQYPRRRWDLFKHVLRVAANDWIVLVDLDTSREQVLTTLLRKVPTTAWKCIAEIYRETSEHRNFALRHWLAKGGQLIIGDDSPGPIQYVPSKVLFGWVDENVEEHAYWLSGILPKTLDRSNAGRLTRDFVARYGKDEGICRRLNGHFHSRGWCGKASDHYRKLREEARAWLEGEKNLTVIRWIEDYIEGLSYDIERAEIEEERRV